MRYASVALLLTLLLGCGGKDPAPSKPDATSPPQGAPAAKAPAVDPNKLLPEPPGESARVPAKPGVGEKGRDIEHGPVGTPIKALFQVKEILDFARVAQAMEFYKAVYGHYPKTHEEFMREIVEKNDITLPKLPAGSRYAYDAEKAAKMSSYDAEDPPLLVEGTR